MIKKRRSSESVIKSNPKYKRKKVNYRFSLETLEYLDEMMIKYSHLYNNRSHMVEAAVRRLYYLHKQGAFNSGAVLDDESVVRYKKIVHEL